jgi:hypothetical protein
VEDASGKPLQGLTASNFKASIGKKDTNVLQAGPDHPPENIMIILDMSGSMGQLFEMQSSLRFISEFIQQTSPETRIAIMSFNDLAYIDQDFTTDRKRVADVVQKYTDTKMWRGSTAMYDALTLGISRVRHMPAESSEIILISDGEDTASRSTFGQTESFLGVSGVRLFAIHVIAPPSGYNPRYTIRKALDVLAQASGGGSIWLSPSNPSKNPEGFRWEYKVEKDFSNMHDIAGEMIREMWNGYELEIALPARMSNPAKVNLQFVDATGNEKQKATLIYPETIYPCPNNPKN